MPIRRWRPSCWQLRPKFYAGKTQTEVASEIGISQAQVSRLEKSAIGKIKKNMQA